MKSPQYSSPVTMNKYILKTDINKYKGRSFHLKTDSKNKIPNNINHLINLKSNLVSFSDASKSNYSSPININHQHSLSGKHLVI